MHIVVILMKFRSTLRTTELKIFIASPKDPESVLYRSNLTPSRNWQLGPSSSECHYKKRPWLAGPPPILQTPPSTHEGRGETKDGIIYRVVDQWGAMPVLSRLAESLCALRGSLQFQRSLSPFSILSYSVSISSVCPFLYFLF